MPGESGGSDGDVEASEPPQSSAKSVAAILRCVPILPCVPILRVVSAGRCPQKSRSPFREGVQTIDETLLRALD